jgi:hypothetical protein
VSDTFLKLVTRSFVVVAVFAVVTTVAHVFQTRRLDALEKRMEALEGKP